MTLTEYIVEDAALTWFGELGYAVGHGPQMALGNPKYPLELFLRVIAVSLETMKIVNQIPSLEHT